MKPVNTNDSFLQAYDQYADAIFRHCFFRVFDRERAQELMQEAFMKTWEVVAGGQEIQNLRAFLYRVANNLIIDNARKKKSASLEKMQEEQGFDPGHDIRNSLDATIEGKDLVKLVSALEPKYREVLMMRYVDDLTPKEIAAIIDETENNVSVRLHRATQQIRDLGKQKHGR